MTCRVPAIVRWPGLDAGRTDTALHYQVDFAATIVDLLGGTVPSRWDGRSFASALRGAPADGEGRDYLVLSCVAWATQRSVRFDDYLCIRTYHDVFHAFPPFMLFDVERDPHEQFDVADLHPDVVARAVRLLLDWETTSMERSPSGVDPLSTVIGEGGGYYTRGRLEQYLVRLAETGRCEQAERIQARLHVGRAVWRTGDAESVPA